MSHRSISGHSKQDWTPCERDIIEECPSQSPGATEGPIQPHEKLSLTLTTLWSVPLTLTSGGWLCGVDSLLPPLHGFQGLNSDLEVSTSRGLHPDVSHVACPKAS